MRPCRKKITVVVHAEQFFPDKLPWPEGVVISDVSHTGFIIKTMENQELGQFVTPGDYIMLGVRGERYPCNPEVFEETYEWV